jgi:hypothetical protein
LSLFILVFMVQEQGTYTHLSAIVVAWLHDAVETAIWVPKGSRTKDERICASCFIEETVLTMVLRQNGA